MSTSSSVSARGKIVLFLMAVLGLAILGYGLFLVTMSSMPLPLGIAIALLGATILACVYFAREKIRAAWAFLCSINGTCVMITLFGAPKIRDSAELSMGQALVPCFVFACAFTLLIVFADEILS